MNKILPSAALILIFSMNARSQDDQLAIKAVIEKETSAYLNIDSTAWKSFWLDTPYTYWAYSDSTGGNYIAGTKEIFKNFRDYFRTAKPAKSKVEREWIVIRMYGKGAYARYNQKVSDETEHDVTTEVRVLEKDSSGKWKIICMSAMALYPPNKQH